MIIDVRTEVEFAMGAYPKAVNIPAQDLPGRLSELPGKDEEIIVYCASGARSDWAMNFLNSEGYTKVENGGGLNDMMARA